MITILLQKILDLLREKLGLINTKPETGSGASVSFETDKELALDSLTAEITAQQEGSGDPSPENVRPISGFSSVSVYQNSKNLVTLSKRAESTTNGIKSKVEGDNLIVASGTSTANAGDIAISTPETYLKAGTYTVSFNGTDTRDSALICYLQDKNTGLGNRVDLASSAHSYQVTLTKDITLVGLLLRTTNTHTITMNAKYQIEVGSTASAYESPAQQNKITVDLGNTYYGGNLDVINGIFKQTQSEKIKIKDLTWNYNSTYQVFVCTDKTEVIKKAELGHILSGFMCEVYKNVIANANTMNTGEIGVNNSGNIIIKDTNYTTETALKAAVGEYYLSFPLASYVEITGLTKGNFITLKGVNNIFANSGNVEAGYRISNEMAAANKDISSDVIVNTTDFSSVSYKIIRSGNVVMISLYSATVVNSYPEALFSGLPKGYNNANIIFIDTVSGNTIQGVMSATGYLSASMAEANQRISCIITYITKDEV